MYAKGLILLAAAVALAGCPSDLPVPGTPPSTEMIAFPSLRVGFVAEYTGDGGVVRDFLGGTVSRAWDPAGEQYAVRPGHIARIRSDAAATTILDAAGRARPVYQVTLEDVSNETVVPLAAQHLEAETLLPIAYTATDAWRQGGLIYIARDWEAPGIGISLDLSFTSGRAVRAGDPFAVSVDVGDRGGRTLEFEFRAERVEGRAVRLVGIERRGDLEFTAFELVFERGDAVPSHRVSRWPASAQWLRPPLPNATLQLARFSQGSGPAVGTTPAAVPEAVSDVAPSVVSWASAVPPEASHDYLLLTAREAFETAKRDLPNFSSFLEKHPDARAFSARYEGICTAEMEDDTLEPRSCAEWTMRFVSNATLQGTSVAVRRLAYTDPVGGLPPVNQTSAREVPFDRERWDGRPIAFPSVLLPVDMGLEFARRFVEAPPEALFWDVSGAAQLQIFYPLPSHEGGFSSGIPPDLVVDLERGLVRGFFGPPSMLRG